MILPYLVNLPAPKKMGASKQSWRPSRTEVMDSFIGQAATSELLRAKVHERKSKLSSMGLTFQPSVFYIGENVRNYTQCFVVINDVYYSFKNILTAFDVTFKCIHALQACYPAESELIWVVVQRLFYKIETKYDRFNTSSKALLSAFNLIH